MPRNDYNGTYDRADKTRRRALNLVDQITAALKKDGRLKDDEELSEMVCNVIDGATAGIAYLGDSLCAIAAAIHEGNSRARS
jgi:hypothetical protein